MAHATKKRRARKAGPMASEGTSDNVIPAAADGSDMLLPSCPDNDAHGLEQIRDILFGAQSRDLNQQIFDLSAQLNSDIEALRADLSGQVQGLKTSMDDQLEELREHIQKESRARDTDIDKLEGMLHRQREELEEALGELGQSSAGSMAENKQALEARIEAVASTLAAAEKALEAQIAELQLALDNSKVGRTDLALLMAEVASRLEGVSKDPDVAG